MTRTQVSEPLRSLEERCVINTTANKAKHEGFREIESISGFRSYSFP